MELSRFPDEMAAQARYARWLAWSVRLGLGMLVATFLAYVFGLITPHVPIAQLPELWRLPASEFLQRTGVNPGWGWASALQRGDMLVLAAIAFLSSCSAVCIAAVVPIFRSRGERAFVAVCAVTIGVLVLAASGLLAGGH